MYGNEPPKDHWQKLCFFWHVLLSCSLSYKCLSYMYCYPVIYIPRKRKSKNILLCFNLDIEKTSKRNVHPFYATEKKCSPSSCLLTFFESYSFPNIFNPLFTRYSISYIHEKLWFDFYSIFELSFLKEWPRRSPNIGDQVFWNIINFKGHVELLV